ncbi:isoleucine--tRNA ligase [bacterium]|nr:isoleucine--tRNA ligase [bacterium]RQV97954.1 MAG: isoleucine--tRNA ligase [bacterium]
MPFKEVKNPVQFSELEKNILKFWDDHKIFEKSISSRPNEKSFIFYEGPPTANGKPGIHHVISRSVKDFVCRYKTMLGYQVHRKAGWDTHGLPVEIEVEKMLGIEHKEQIESYGVDKFNKKCRDSVFKYVKEWNELTRRIAYWVDLDNPYITYTNDYIESVWWLLSQMFEKDLLYQGFKILPYCSRCETALSSHETSLGYREVTDQAIVAKFPLIEGDSRYILAWTTTPWTLPGNVALAVGEEIVYVEVQQITDQGREIYYLAENRMEMLKGEYQVIRKLSGKDLIGWKYHPLFDFINLSSKDHPAYYIAAADFVTTEEGTGVVHTAVMYGEDDYRLGMQLGLPTKHTVDEQGKFTDLVSKWQGMHVKDPETEKAILLDLKKNSRLYRSDKYRHSYPHCWRCDSPLLYYAKKSWYIKTTEIKDRMIANNQAIQWFPREVGEGRFGQWLENNIDWAISRDRYWGTPLNIWICEKCGKRESVGSIAVLKQRSGLEIIEDLHKPYIDEVTFPCVECHGVMKRTSEVIDCWFDSGAMPYAQFHYPFAKDENFENNFPADFIAEGVDQTRGWFYSLLAISTIISGKPSYRQCISIEMILDKDGQKMSKSRGNAVDPFRILNEEGADPLRWYLFTVSPPWVPTRFDREGVREVKRKFFGTLANTYTFFVLYANIDGFDCQEALIPVPNRQEIDRWLISTLNHMVQKVWTSLQRYDVTKASRAIQTFVIDDLSNWYIRRNRRRFWKSEMGPDKISAYQTLYETLFTVSKLIAPISPFLSEDIYLNLNSVQKEPYESVHLANYPDPKNDQYQFRDTTLEIQMDAARNVVQLCRAARNEAGIKVRQPLNKALIAVSGERMKTGIEAFQDLILEEINVHKLEFVDDAAKLMTKQARPVFKKLGPKFGSQVNQVAEIIRGFQSDEIQRLENGESIHISVDKGKHGDIVLDDIEICHEAAHGLEVQTNGNCTIALDTHLNEALVAEGLAREFINRIQNMRKSADFDVSDRIRVFYNASPAARRAIRSKHDLICQEVLAVDLQEGFQSGEYQKTWQVDKDTFKIGIERDR